VVEHTANYATIELSSSLDQDATNESWAIRDFSIWRDGGLEKPLFDSSDWVHISDEFEADELDESMVTSWTLEGNNGVISSCGSTKLIGGYGNFGGGAKMTKTFTEIEKHTKLRIQLQVWKIDSWDNEEFFCIIDGN